MLDISEALSSIDIELEVEKGLATLSTSLV